MPKPRTTLRYCLTLAGLLAFSPLARPFEDRLGLPKTGLSADELAVVVNDSDPLSVGIGEYYQAKRGIPPQNLLHVSFAVNGPVMNPEAFTAMRGFVLNQTKSHIQAYAIAWLRPYRVGCMSITSAFAFGYDAAYCSAYRCSPTKPSPYFNTDSTAPFADFGMRPAMLLAATSLNRAKQLIDRGIQSDYTYPAHTGYLLKTQDQARSVRSAYFADTLATLGKAFKLERLESDSIKGKQDVLFYFTGFAWVRNLDSLRFVPGAMADHLTSIGGELDGCFQMSSLRWLEFGATGSFGTVAEPCNHVEKFPLPPVAIWHYAKGNTLLEAYWKSVAWPGEGLFIGEPLARPFAPRLRWQGKDDAELALFAPEDTAVYLLEAESPVGPFLPLAKYAVHAGLNRVGIHLPRQDRFYRLRY